MNTHVRGKSFAWKKKTKQKLTPEEKGKWRQSYLLLDISITL